MSDSVQFDLPKCNVGQLLFVLSELPHDLEVHVPIYPPGDDETNDVRVEVFRGTVTIEGYDPPAEQARRDFVQDTSLPRETRGIEPS